MISYFENVNSLSLALSLENKDGNIKRKTCKTFFYKLHFK
jgi:hypothetical protein